MQLKKRLTFTVNGVSFKLCLVTHGTFLMGADKSTDPDACDWEGPVHEVSISRDYYVAETLVTQELYEAVMGENPANFFFSPKHPVEQVNWNSCQKFVSKLNKLIPDGTFSLPTEAEWEFAARGGNSSKGYRFAGSDDADEVSCNGDNSPDETIPVASYAPNELGLYDMSGNVWEWCQDFYDTYSADSVTDPTGPESGEAHVLRGGGFYGNVNSCRVTARGASQPLYNNANLGFRFVFHPAK